MSLVRLRSCSSHACLIRRSRLAAAVTFQSRHHSDELLPLFSVAPAAPTATRQIQMLDTPKYDCWCRKNGPLLLTSVACPVRAALAARSSASSSSSSISNKCC
jgi:hypothetical protein